jgi:hypothetical protein
MAWCLVKHRHTFMLHVKEWTDLSSKESCHVYDLKYLYN